MPPASYDFSAFGQENFGDAKLGDARRTKSLIDLANRLSRHPNGSLPDKFKDPNALRRLYDLMNTEQVTHAAVLRPHVSNTASQLLRHKGVALCLHDTTELDYSSHKSLHDQLGQIGDGFGHGYECHNSLVVLPDGKRVLGLLSQQLHVRADAPQGETPAQRRERQDRESLLWPRGAKAAQEAVERACHDKGLPGGRPPEELLLVDVCDRGGDSFEMLDYEDLSRRKYTIRSKHNREIRGGEGADAKKAKLHGHLRTLPEQGRREITVHGHDGEAPRQAAVAVCWAMVVLIPPHQQCGFSRRLPLTAWALRVWEVAPPKGVEPVEWFLLTNVAVNSLGDAWQRVDWYCARWIVEELHKAQKTGCNIEDPQFETAEAMQPMIALLSVVAIALLNLREMSRNPQTQDQPASTVVPVEQVEVLSGWRYGRRRELTVGEFFLALARLGGHQNRKKDHPPGWLVLWRGWQSLQLMVAGARAARAPAAPLQPPKEDIEDDQSG